MGILAMIAITGESNNKNNNFSMILGRVEAFSFPARKWMSPSSIRSQYSSSSFVQRRINPKDPFLAISSSTTDQEESIDQNNDNTILPLETTTTTTTMMMTTTKGSKRTRFREALPQFLGLGDGSTTTATATSTSSSTTDATTTTTPSTSSFSSSSSSLDSLILKTAIPSMINLAVVPIVNAVDTFWVGRLGIALALAGQSAANQACFTIFFMIAFLPNITAPLVAKAVASGNTEQAQDRVSESLWLCNVLGLMGTTLLFLFPQQVLSKLVLDVDSPAMAFAAPYLRWRALGMVPSLISATGSAAYRGMLNTVTPLKVSLVTNAMNLVLDPLCIFSTPVGFVGAAIATAISEGVGGLIYLNLLVRRKLIKWSKFSFFRPPPWSAIRPLLQGGAAMLIRQLAINIGFLVATKRAQMMDPSGVSGAAYGIVMQLYSVFLICKFPMSPPS